MTCILEERLREITAMLHLTTVQETEWMKNKLEHERNKILEELRDK